MINIFLVWRLGPIPNPFIIIKKYGLINELDKNSFDVLAYTGDLCVLWEDKNKLMNILKIIDKLRN